MWCPKIGALCFVLIAAGGGQSSAKVPNPTSAQAPVVTSLAADLKAVDAFLTDVEGRYAATRKPGEKTTPSKTGVWWMPEAWCAKRLSYPKNQSLERCIVREIGQRRAALVISVKRCEPEHCETDYFILSGTSGVRKTSIQVEGGLIVSSDSRAFFMGELGYVTAGDGSGPTGYRANLMRVDLGSLESRRVANCTVPVLSPSGRWIVCRDENGHVHRVSRDGKQSRRVHTIDLAGERISGDAHIGLNITAPTFLADGRLRIETDTTGETDVEVIKWEDK